MAVRYREFASWTLSDLAKRESYEGRIIFAGNHISVQHVLPLRLHDETAEQFAARLREFRKGLPRYSDLSKDARALVDETLRSLSISHLAERPIHELSVGEKKRVAIAGVLVLHPKNVLLDEPTAGLDFAGITAMLALLKKLHAEGTTLVISTHDTDLAYEWANEAWVLGDGRVAAQGPIGEVMQDRATLHQAHLKVPWVVELGLVIRDTYPELGAQPLPATPDEPIQLIQQIRFPFRGLTVETQLNAE